ncbi:hypothetical protein EJ08DRAFT_271123 [Tothia fuscella]|uniref:Homeobox domain-containing protein n=1 Tax=Tothia fuscella TaxID=1048955 RepID=A0A9P4TXV3_9PEZI|nr:hypothetical protein EJ08DRAFT_271123 [Tothia fuscella]
MDHDSVLQSTGGLPPSVFSLDNSMSLQRLDIDAQPFQILQTYSIDREPSMEQWMMEPPLLNTMDLHTPNDISYFADTSPHLSGYHPRQDFEGDLNPFSNNLDPYVPLGMEGLRSIEALGAQEMGTDLDELDLICEPLILIQMGVSVEIKPKTDALAAGSARKKRFTISDQAKGILDATLARSFYPQKAEIAAVAHFTGMTSKQVATYFGNVRSRKFKSGVSRSQETGESNPSPKSAKLTKSSLENLGKQFDGMEKNPTMARFLESPFHEFPIIEAALREARGQEPMSLMPSEELIPFFSYKGANLALSYEGATSPLPIKEPTSPPREDSIHAVRSEMPSVPVAREPRPTPPGTSLRTTFRRPPVTPTAKSGSRSRANSVGSRRSSGGSVRSWGSAGSNASVRGSRKGRRVANEPYPSYSTEHFVPGKAKTVWEWDGNMDRFHCTFCPAKFSGRYEWNRHEESRHVPQATWLCQVTRAKWLGARCAYCFESYPSLEHLDTHKCAECATRAPHERTFYRKDHLDQHLRKFHAILDQGAIGQLMASGKTEPDTIEPGHITLRCGFCGFQAPNWQVRVDHIAQHFWRGDSVVEWWLHRKENKISADTYRSAWQSHSECADFGIGCVRKYRTVDPSAPKPLNQTHWSCSFLRSFQSAFLYSTDFGEAIKAQCVYCGREWNFPSWAEEHKDYSERLLHLVEDHAYRSCSQEWYICTVDFWRHLRVEHGSQVPATLQKTAETLKLFEAPRRVNEQVE